MKPQKRVDFGGKKIPNSLCPAIGSRKSYVAIRTFAGTNPIIDGHIYALRNLVERCFSKLKHSRRLATRYDKTADSYVGFVLVAAIRLWVRHFVNRT